MVAIEPGGVGEGLPGQLEALTYGLATDKAAAEFVRACGGVEGAIVGHEAHQRVEVVTVPGLGKGGEKFCSGLGLIRHLSLLGLRRWAGRFCVGALASSPECCGVQTTRCWPKHLEPVGCNRLVQSAGRTCRKRRYTAHTPRLGQAGASVTCAKSLTDKGLAGHCLRFFGVVPGREALGPARQFRAPPVRHQSMKSPAGNNWSAACLR